jgi:anthranilate synthase/aminodeoxychorismate synthase-like glutamine amidotransferase
MILLIDNYDSFVYNLARYVRELGEEPLVRRHDAVTVGEILGLAPSHIIISPGPCSPREAGVSTEVVRALGPRIPILGVCLGHQCIGAAYGGEIVRAGQPMHGKTSRVHHSGTGLFAGLPSPFYATRYHSLVIAPGSVPPELEVQATSEDGEIMAVRHTRHPVHGVQFHPESVLTEHGYRMVDHFLHGVPASPRALPATPDAAPGLLQGERSTLASNPPPVDLVR